MTANSNLFSEYYLGIKAPAARAWFGHAPGLCGGGGRAQYHKVPGASLAEDNAANVANVRQSKTRALRRSDLIPRPALHLQWTCPASVPHACRATSAHIGARFCPPRLGSARLVRR